MNSDNLKEEVTNVLKTITSFGYMAYLVGGAIRDKLTGQPINDYDICTNMPLEMIKELFPSFHIMKPNQQRNAGVMMLEGVQIEIAELKGKTLQEDLVKRDFTINTILEDADGNIYDYLHAQEDIKRKIIRLVNEDGSTFDEHAFRILRGLRLAAKLGYKIEENCYHHMLRTRDNLKKVPAEKLYSELKRIIKEKDFPTIFEEIKPFLLVILPELANTDMERTNALLKKSPHKLLIRLFIIMAELTEEEIIAISKRLKMDKKTTKSLLYFESEKKQLPAMEPSQVKNFITKYSVEFIEAFFTYQEIKLDDENEEALIALRKREEVYYRALQRELEKQIRNLHINPTVFKKYGSRKDLVIIENEFLSKVRKQQIAPTLEDTQKYLALKANSQ